MDLFATLYLRKELVRRYIEKHYGFVPRLLGVRFMRYEDVETCEKLGMQSQVWAKYCGQDVIYIHTQCGGGYDETDPDSNYIACGGKGWEEDNKETFLESVDDFYNAAYRDHYFKAVIDDDYNEICKQFEEGVLI